MGIPLPPKIFKTLAPAIKGHVGVAREIKFAPFLKAFTGYFGCIVDKRKGNLFKVSPPPPGRGIWVWPRVPYFVRKPANGTLVREDLHALQKTFKLQYHWDRETIVRGPGRSKNREG